MPSASPSAPTSKKMLWVSYIVSAVPVLLLLLSATAKFLKPAAVVQGFTQQFGFPAGLITPIGIIEVTCTAIYLIPRTSVLGAILLTGYLGGATVTHLRVGDPALVGAVFAGILVWGGLFFREPRVRALIPFRSPNLN